LFDRGQPHRGTHHEHAAVPEIVALREVTGGGGRIGLLDEFGHATRAFGARLGVGAHVAEAGLGPVGLDAQQHDGAAIGHAHRLAQRFGEGRLVGHRLVGGRDHQHRVGVALARMQGGQRQRRRGVAPCRFEQQRGGR